MVQSVLFFMCCGALLFSGCGETENKLKMAVPVLKIPVLRHIVLIKYKDGTTPDEEKSVENAFRALKDKITVIHSFECGTNVSPEDLNQGFTHCFQLAFLSDAHRDEYLPHPAHREFGALLRPHIDKILVIDYWAKE